MVACFGMRCCRGVIWGDNTRKVIIFRAKLPDILSDQKALLTDQSSEICSCKGYLLLHAIPENILSSWEFSGGNTMSEL